MSFFKKWYTYQKERFPVLIYGLYIFCIVFAVFSFNNYFAFSNYERLKGIVFSVGIEEYAINYYKIIPMFIICFLQFLMIRIIDEFKDYDEDLKYRPYRPVPRGLITLKELKILFIICVILQLLITFFVNAHAIFLLLIMWGFFAIMSKGFFMKKFLDKHMLIEVFLDELLMPILVLYLSSYVYYIDYSNIWKLLLISYIISWIVEVARKVRCVEDEEEGVRTYTAIFGIQGAVLILFILETFLMVLQLKTLTPIYMYWIIGAYVLVNICNLLFLKKKNRTFAKITELSANMHIMFVYLSMGLLIM